VYSLPSIEKKLFELSPLVPTFVVAGSEDSGELTILSSPVVGHQNHIFAMTKSSPTKARYNMQASAAGTTAGGSGSPSSSKLDIMLSYSGSSQSTGSTSIFPGMPKTPERDNKNKVQHNWVGQPLIPRRITAKKKKKKVPRALNTGYISSDTSRDASIEQHHVCHVFFVFASIPSFSGFMKQCPSSPRLIVFLLVHTRLLFLLDSAY
jgi:hypothetical protein